MAKGWQDRVKPGDMLVPENRIRAQFPDWDTVQVVSVTEMHGTVNFEIDRSVGTPSRPSIFPYYSFLDPEAKREGYSFHPETDYD